jgi:hypothetical protein
MRIGPVGRPAGPGEAKRWVRYLFGSEEEDEEKQICNAENKRVERMGRMGRMRG